ncbi:LIMR family protein DDB_G0293610 [Durusdinium trenchii]
MLICVVKGCTKFGMRVAFFISIHPMRAQNTPLNSILFNVEMLLISTAAMVQFSQTTFSDYARLTEADVIFSAQIQRLRFYRFLIAFIFFLVRPRDQGSITFSAPDQKLVSLADAAKAGDKC